ncbi:MAG: type II secretion system F family protein [Bdellovibrionales bacterium]|nr:type II secretion system F family protein [Bdellovibrionales bacterium]
MIPLFGFFVFILIYLNADRMLAYFHRKSLGNREEILRLLNLMFVETNKDKLTFAMLLISFGFGAMVFLLFWPHFFFGVFMGSVVTVLGWSAPKVVVTSLWNSRCDKITDQLVDGLTIMGNGVKAGLSVAQSMERVSENMTGPLVQEFNLVLNKMRLGMNLEDALNEFGNRVPRQDVQMLVTSINILKETGGNLAETFETIVNTVRERQKIEKRIQALTAQGKMQATIITLVPFILLGVFVLVDPNYVMPLFTRPMGWFILIIMLTLQVIGGVMMRKIVNIKV